MADYTTVRRNVFCIGCKDIRHCVYVTNDNKQFCFKCMQANGLSVIPDLTEAFIPKQRKVEIALVSAELKALLENSEELTWDFEPLSTLSGFRLVAYIDE